MKWFIASDIHGSAYYCKKMLEAYKKENAQRLLLLGDLLYHGPRNNLPRDYDPRAVIEMLNEYKNEIIAVRGNCDSEVDQMVLAFPILSDYAVICDGDITVFATHGHIFTEDKLPPLKKGDFLLSGHTHVVKMEERGDYTYINPGSVSIPKENTPHGYLILENGKFIHKTLL